MCLHAPMIQISGTFHFGEGSTTDWQEGQGSVGWRAWQDPTSGDQEWTENWKLRSEHVKSVNKQDS